MPTAVPCSARIASAARRPSSVWVGGMRMSTIATSGRCSRVALSKCIGLADLSNDLESRVGKQTCDSFAYQDRIISQDEPQGHGRSTKARMAGPEISSLGMKPRK